MWVRIHDINFTIVDFGIFVFYFGFTYFLLRNAGKQQANSRQSQVHRQVSSIKGVKKKTLLPWPEFS
jgi:hypothetical protein